MVSANGNLPKQRTDADYLQKRFGYSQTLAKRLSENLFYDIVVLYATAGHTANAIAECLGKHEIQIQAVIDTAKDSGEFENIPF